jgi:hypothetical protein
MPQVVLHYLFPRAGGTASVSAATKQVAHNVQSRPRRNCRFRSGSSCISDRGVLSCLNGKSANSSMIMDAAEFLDSQDSILCVCEIRCLVPEQFPLSPWFSTLYQFAPLLSLFSMVLPTCVFVSLRVSLLLLAFGHKSNTPGFSFPNSVQSQSSCIFSVCVTPSQGVHFTSFHCS